MKNQPKVTDLQADRKKTADQQAGAGGIAQLKADIEAIKGLPDVIKVLEKIVKVMVQK